MTDYIKFCEDPVIKKKEVVCYPNTKPWINKELREALSSKNKAFKNHDKEALAACGKKTVKLNVDGKLDEYANKLNGFYARFDVHDFRSIAHLKMKNILNDLSECEEFTIQENDVKREFRMLNTKKACGPDGLSGFILKSCCEELSGIFTTMFNLSI